MWIGVLWAGLRVAMWITHVGGKFRHGLLEKSLISRQKIASKILRASLTEFWGKLGEFCEKQKKSMSSLCHTNNRLKGTHWALSPETRWGPKNSASSVFETVLLTVCKLGALSKARLRKVHFSGDFLGVFDFLRIACSLGIPQGKPLNLIKPPIFTNALVKPPVFAMHLVCTLLILSETVFGPFPSQKGYFWTLKMECPRFWAARGGRIRKTVLNFLVPRVLAVGALATSFV